MRYIRLIAVGAILLTAAGCFAQEEPFLVWMGKEAIKIGMQVAAAKLVDRLTAAPAAPPDSPQGEFNKGLAYQNGNGVPKDPEKALTWFEKAAGHEYADAQCILGDHYVELQNYPKALEWYQRAASHINAWGQYHVGYLLDGQFPGVTQNRFTATHWMEKAAEQSWLQVQYIVGVRYATGTGAQQNPQESAKWFEMAAAGGYAPAQSALAVAYGNGFGRPQDQQQAMLWARRAADQGEANAEFNLGASYENGRGVPVDNCQAVWWYRKAAAQGDQEAQQALDRISRRVLLGACAFR